MRRPGPTDGRGGRRGDAGTTLVEQLVAMSIFMVVVAVFMSAVVSMTTSTSRTQNTADAGDSVRSAFLRMDRQVRYANAVNLPGRGASGDWFVEFRSPQRTSATTALCTQWRYDVTGGRFLMRTWTDGSTPPTTWTTTATVLAGPTTPPFTVVPASPEHPFQQLSVDLSAGRGRGAAAGGAQIQTSFVARNSSPASPSNIDLNGDGTSDTPVCTGGVRA